MTVGETPEVELNFVSQNNVSCNGGSDGTITVAASSGEAPYSFLWSNGSTSPTADQLTVGTYLATVTDANNCEDVLTFTVTEPAAIQANPNVGHETSFEGNDGSITLAPTGGTGNLSIEWSTGATGNSISGLSPGMYEATLTDDNGCQNHSDYRQSI
ncbi:MAG: hypothetical protein R2784_03970 [Saprospiraceae bacterium]